MGNYGIDQLLAGGVLVVESKLQHTPTFTPPQPMGRSAAKSVARVYADVNAKLGPSWHEYGAIRFCIILHRL